LAHTGVFVNDNPWEKRFDLLHLPELQLR
jgi:hypothetical protein